MNTSYTPDEDEDELDKAFVAGTENMNDQEDEGLQGNISDNPIPDNRAIVFLSYLLPLLRICQIFFSHTRITKFVSRDSNVLVTRQCTEIHSTEWRSQPKIKVDMSAGILLLSSVKLFTGNTSPGMMQKYVFLRKNI